MTERGRSEDPDLAHSIQEVNEDLYKDSVDSPPVASQHDLTDNLIMMNEPSQIALMQEKKKSKVRFFESDEDVGVMLGSGPTQQQSFPTPEIHEPLKTGSSDDLEREPTDAPKQAVYFDSLENLSSSSEDDEEEPP